MLALAAALRALRHQAGMPPYRELARRAHYSAATLSEAAGGRRLPSLAVTMAYVRACGGDPTLWQKRWHRTAAAVAATAGEPDPPDRPEEGRPPYVGLAAFQPQDADLFHGRGRLADELLRRLATSRFLAVFGASGSGKSSLVRAGVLARWQAADPHRLSVLFTPGDHPLEECAIALATAGHPRRDGELLADLRSDERALHRAVRTLLADRPHSELLLVVDQFEEVFTLCQDRDERAHFVQSLVSAAQAHGSRCRVVLSVRADFYAHCTRYPRLVEALRDAQVAVGPMTTDELREAIVRPAVGAQCSVEHGLLAELIAQAAGRTGALPLLSHVLLETWRRRRGNTLTHAGFQQAGGFDGALAHTAESVFTELTARQQRLARYIFLRLTALGEGTEDTRRRVTHTELDAGDSDVDVVLGRLATARLIVLDGGTVEIAHEAIIRCWPRLHGWLTEDREALRVHRQLTEDTGVWLSLDRDPGALYRGVRLAMARDWAARHGAALTPREEDFVRASEAAEAVEAAAARRRSRRLLQLLALVSALLVVTAAVSVYAVRAERRAERQRDIATSQRVAETATGLRRSNPALATQLSLAAYRLHPTVEARGSLLSTFFHPYATRLAVRGGVAHTVSGSPDGALLAVGDDAGTRVWNIARPHRAHQLKVPVRRGTHTVPTWATAFGPDNRTVAAGGADGRVRLWSIGETRRPGGPVELPGRAEAGVRSLAFSPDGRLLAATSPDAGSSLRLWSLGGSGPPRPLSPPAGHGSATHTVAFSPDGRTLATAGAEGVRLLDPRSPANRNSSGRVTAHPAVTVAFSADGRLLATGHTDRSVRLWRLTGPGGVRWAATVQGDSDTVKALAFSPDGRTLATTGVSRHVRLWSVADPRRPARVTTFEGHTGIIETVTFAANGRTLITGGQDQAVRLWDLPGPAFVGHRSSVYSVAFAPSGRQLASGSYDRTVRLWDPDDPSRPPAVLFGHTAAVNSVSYRATGAVLASASLDRTVRLWSTTGSHRTLAVLRGHTAAVSAVSFSPAGDILASGSLDGTVRLWSTAEPTRPRLLRTLYGDGPNESLSFSPDGRLLATGGRHRTAALWNVSEARAPRRLSVVAGHAGAVKSVGFHPDGHTLTTAGNDSTARLWDIEDPRRPRARATLTAHTNSVYSAAFSADGRILATVSTDHTTRLWDTADPRRPRGLATLHGHTGDVSTAAFSPRGHVLATGSNDWTVHLWNTDPNRVADHICRVSHPPLTPTEWRRFVPGLSYRPPC